MKRTIRTIALSIAALATAVWLVTGANRGFTKTTVPKKIVDEITGIEGQIDEKRFVPGVDFLGAAWLGAGALAGLSFFFKNKNKTKA